MSDTRDHIGDLNCSNHRTDLERGSVAPEGEIPTYGLPAYGAFLPEVRDTPHRSRVERLIADRTSRKGRQLGGPEYITQVLH